MESKKKKKKKKEKKYIKRNPLCFLSLSSNSATDATKLRLIG